MTETTENWPIGWDEKRYLAENPDVAAAVMQGQFSSGYQHYRLHGRAEARPGVIDTIKNAAPTANTRMCLDPWQYVEIQPSGKISPCCNIPGAVDLNNQDSDDLRSCLPFEQLRKELLGGRLRRECRGCHIRPWTSIAKLTAKIDEYRKLEGDSCSPNHRHQPLALDNMRIDINGRCNLRCTYCAVSQPGYHGEEMPEGVFRRALALIAKPNPSLIIDVNGHGETTFHPHWRVFMEAALATGGRVRLLSNFAKAFTAEEAETLSRLDTVMISIDTVDDQLLKTIRRRVSLGTIMTNIAKIRGLASRHGRPSPRWAIICGIYDRNAWGLVDLAWFAVNFDFKHVTFWNLVEYPSIPGHEALQVHSLASLPEHERQAACHQAQEAIQILRSHNITVEVAGDFLPADAD